MSRLPLPISHDQYAGWAPRPLTSVYTPEIPRITNQISREEMWNEYIRKRRPVVIQGTLSDPEWAGERWTDLEYLRSVAGNVPVKIEPIHPTAGHFGTSAARKTVPFSEYIDILQDPSQAGKWYLTTQYDDGDEGGDEDNDTGSSSSSEASGSDLATHDGSIIGALDGGKADFKPEIDTVLPAPTNALSNDFPARPDLLGQLVLQQCNLWLGSSKEGKSSGLHHDFHDNLYILLSGYKRFLLFPPSAHRHLHPRGQIEKVHPNGLIVYTAPGEVPPFAPGARQRLSIRPDGLVPSDAARWRRQARLRVKQEIDDLAAAACGEGEKHRQQRKGKAKQTHAQELAEQAFLQAEAELLLCRMDEEGIDPNANTSDEEDEGDDGEIDSEDNERSARLRRIMAARGLTFSNGRGGSDEEDEELSSEDDVYSESEEEGSQDGRMEDLLDRVPEELHPLARRAFMGDKEAMDIFCQQVNRLTEGAPGSLDSDSDEDPTERKAPPPDLKRIHGLDDDFDSDGGGSPPFTSFSAEEHEDGDPPSDAESSGGERERKMADGKSSRKKVKIASEIQSIEALPGPDSDEGSEDDEDMDDDGDGDGFPAVGDDMDDDEDDDDSGDDSDDSGPPLFPEADSGSEFGDVDAGEAELQRLLALSGQADDDDDDDDDGNDAEDKEPQSFSLVHPRTLHAHFGIPDDPCRPPAAAASNGSRSGSSTSKAKGNSKKKASRVAVEDVELKGPRPLLDCPEPFEVFLRPGEMLYLPASWYHEVTSSSLPPYGSDDATAADEGSSSSGKSGAGAGADQGFHMALNYWFHPPDALKFEPSKAATSSGTNSAPKAPGTGQDTEAPGAVHVPGLGVEVGESATENLQGGTGSCERPYRDAEVWDEVARTVYAEVARCRSEAARWAMGRGGSEADGAKGAEDKA
ncbi:uncharacterized protein PFL1_01255 [Pseudozyma flocculosa PF-1]|uniref:JmjC domain-containing protein n=1 Tax=Pseudozyma flocculosa TaxID=84751 RepID=A0A5C3EVY9_9BASI|nr:uncharacterized protein PFL1_01255 [Pseudozyma flocculosa PF-1]EPQ31066.1 hypothetical protein PFL1_01255 [Pseudozyma flocculosa PF-1]SPO35915.1 uncharacterized protein PSFLO_01386 [Pseudozyma flocculosa]